MNSGNGVADFSDQQHGFQIPINPDVSGKCVPALCSERPAEVCYVTTQPFRTFQEGRFSGPVPELQQKVGHSLLGSAPWLKSEFLIVSSRPTPHRVRLPGRNYGYNSGLRNTAPVSALVTTEAYRARYP